MDHAYSFYPLEIQNSFYFCPHFGVTEWGNRFPVSKRESGENPELYP